MAACQPYYCVLYHRVWTTVCISSSQECHEEQEEYCTGVRMPHFQNLLCCLDPFQLEVGNTNSLCESLLLAVCQPLHKGIIAPAIGNETRPMYHVQAEFADSKPFQTFPARKDHYIESACQEK